MLNVFDVFKIILGIIIAVFILILLLRFAGSYMQLGESSRQASMMVNFRKAAENAYTTGISGDFETGDAEVMLGYRPPFIETSIAMVNMEPVPLLLLPARKLSLHRNEYDLGWWKFYFIEAMPDYSVIFVPLGDRARAMPVVGNITRFLPSSESAAAKVKFGFGCSGSEFWFGWERYRFTEAIMPRMLTDDTELATCENAEYFRSRNFTIVTVSEEMKDVDFLVQPVDDDLGYVYIRSDDGYDKYIYKNGLDVAALLLGGKEFYEYVNQKLLGEMEVAADISVNEAAILTTDAEMNRRCGTSLAEFTGILNSLKDVIPKLKASPNENDVHEFAGYVRASAAKYRELDSMGCA